MNFLKRILSLFVAFSLLLSMSGCSFRLTDFDSLLRPPKPGGKYSELQKTFEENVSENYNLVQPVNGEYKSAFLTFDYDKDNNEEAIVFYNEKAKIDTAKFILFKYINDEWRKIGAYDGSGSSVDRVIFIDVNHDGNEEVLIGWSLFSGQVNKIFSVYEIAENEMKLISSFPYNFINTMDANGDGFDDIFTLTTDISVPEIPSSFARIYYYDKDSQQLQILGETKTDGNISAYKAVKIETVDALNLIYVEANKGEFESITEVLYWDAVTNQLVAPLFDVDSQSTKLTWRNNHLVSADIDGDGFLEIPTSVEMQASSVSDSEKDISMNMLSEETPLSKLYFTKWVKFRNNSLKPVQYSVVNEKLGYMLNVHSSWVGRITIVGNEGQWDFYRLYSDTSKLGELLFSIYFYDKDDTESKKKYSTYNVLNSNGDKEFVYMITDDGYDFGVKNEDIEKGFRLDPFGGGK